MEGFELGEELAKSHTLTPGSPPVFYRAGFGDINVNTLTPEKADRLIAAGCTYLEKKQAGKTDKKAVLPESNS